MKRALIASILGLAASAATTFGQGAFAFTTYFSTSSQIVQFRNPDLSLATGFNAGVYYGLGSNVPFGSMTALGATLPINAFGFVSGGNVVVPNYVSGPITFALVGFNGTSWASSPLEHRTQAADVWTWTEPSIQPTSLPANQWTWSIVLAAATSAGKLDGGFPYVLVPEPGTLALAGLGLASLLIFRKRQ